MMLFVLMLIASVTIGQDNVGDIIHLKDGTIIKGEVVEYKPKEKIKIKTKDGHLVSYESSEVARIEKNPKSKPSYIIDERPQHIKEKGWYHTLMGGTVFSGRGLIFGNRGIVPFGFMLDYASGYQFNRYFGLGTSIGFLLPSFEAFVPICANIRGNILKTSFSPFYDINIGYGLSLNGLVTSGTRDGGFHFHPSLGVQFASDKKAHTVLSLGYLMQLGGIHEFNVNAITIKVGVIF